MSETAGVELGGVMRSPQPPAPTELEILLDPAWLTTALADVDHGERVAGVELVGRSQTIAHKVRFATTFEQPDGDTRTQHYCLKAHFNSPGIESLLTETHVYRELLPTVDVRAPRAHYTGIDDSTGRSLIIMDDVDAQGGRFFHAAEPYPLEVCRDALAQLARLHASTWGDDRWDVDWLASRLPSMLEMFDAATLQALLHDGRGVEVSGELLDAARLRAALAATGEWSATCVIHGDTHSGNMYLDRDGRACWLDWQITQRGHWAVDVSYHLATVLTVEDRRAHEQTLLAGYLDELSSLGIEPPEWDEAWERYTLAFSWAYFLWTITRISSREVVLAHLPRIGAALADHSTFDRLGA